MSAESPEFKGQEAENIKKEINAEGQGEENYADLGTYIRMNKEIVLSQDDPEMSEELKKDAFTRKGSFHANNWLIYFFDKDGNFAKVDLNTNQIAGFENKLALDPNAVEHELEKLGFKFADTLPSFYDALEKKKSRLENEAKEKKEKEFDF